MRITVWVEEKEMPDGFEGLPAHIVADIARKDAMVLELCERIGFGYVMESAARQWAKRDPRGAFTVGMPEGFEAEAAKAAMHRITGRGAIDTAIEALTTIGAGKAPMRLRMKASENHDQVAAFVKAAGNRAIVTSKAKAVAGFAYDPETQVLIVDGLEFPLASLDASHGRVYSNPYDEAKTVHTLTLHDAAAGATVKLALA
jgi:hypothetical protein